MYLHLGRTLTEGLGSLGNRTIYSEIKRANFDKLQLDFVDAEVVDGKLLFSFLDEKRIKAAECQPFKSKLRQQAKPGKVLKKLFPTWSDDKVRTLVEGLQGELLSSGEVQIFTVEGDDIRKYYQWPKIFCTKPLNSSAPLQSSCYQGQVLDKYFESVLANPEKYRLVVAKMGHRMDGRAILVHGNCGYTEDSPLGWFCDRVTCNTPANIPLMQAYITKEFNAVFSGAFISRMKPGRALHHMSQLNPILGWEGLFALTSAVKTQNAWASDPVWYVQGSKKRSYSYELPPENLKLPEVYPFPTDETSRYTKLTDELRHF